MLRFGGVILDDREKLHFFRLLVGRVTLPTNCVLLNSDHGFKTIKNYLALFCISESSVRGQRIAIFI